LKKTASTTSLSIKATIGIRFRFREVEATGEVGLMPQVIFRNGCFEEIGERDTADAVYHSAATIPFFLLASRLPSTGLRNAPV
jgi:hypothetical protein